MSLLREILESLERISLNYKGVRVNILGLPILHERNKGSIYAAISQLKKQGLIEKELQGWIITSDGKNYLKRKQDSLKQFKFSFSKNAPRNLLVMFDIPEPQKAEREWFRFQLKKAGYIMIQKSVWVGPSPLPKEFVDYMKEIKLNKAVKTFKLAKAYTVNT